VGWAHKATHAPRPLSALRPHLLYCAGSPVPLTKYSSLRKGISSQSLGSINLFTVETKFEFSETLRYFFLYISCGPHYYHKNRGIKQSPPAEPHGGGRHTYDGVLPCAPKGSFVTLLPPPQCHAVFGTMRHTLASVDQSPVCCPRTLPPSTRMPRVGCWRGIITIYLGRLHFWPSSLL
jgi:hypothetical protein